VAPLARPHQRGARVLDGAASGRHRHRTLVRMRRSLLALARTTATVVAMALVWAGPSRAASAQEPAAPPAAAEPRTNTVAWVSLVSGGACLATGIGFGVASVVEHRLAADIDDQAEDDDALTDADQARYDDAIASRDDFRIVSGITAGTGLGLFLLAGILFARDDASRAAPSPPQPVAARPWLGPGLAGGSATVRF